MAKVKCYVDGFNLYHAINELGRNDLKWLNLTVVAQQMLRHHDHLCGVHYFTSVVHWDREKSQRHRAYIDALKATGVQVTESYFRSNDKVCRRFSRSCPFYEEKQTDVALATCVLRDALCGAAERILVITADADQVPLFKNVREACPQTHIELVAPPGRLHHARELGTFACWRRELTAGQLQACRFPRDVLNAYGKVAARCPANYLPLQSPGS